MKKAQKEKARKKLVEQKEKLEKDLSRIAEKGAELEEDWEARYPDIGLEGSEDLLEDAAVARTIYEGRKGIEQTLEKKLKRTNQALKSLKKGTYGICAKCNEKITKERLEAVPETSLCKNCINAG